MDPADNIPGSSRVLALRTKCSIGVVDLNVHVVRIAHEGVEDIGQCRQYALHMERFRKASHPYIVPPVVVLQVIKMISKVACCWET